MAKNQPESIPKSVRRFVMIAFGFSGAAALIYEVVWTRQLSMVFGSTVYAVSIMLAAFMSGLSLGSWFGGRLADRTRDRLKVFGLLEGGIGVFGFLAIPLVSLTPKLYFLAYSNLQASLTIAVMVQLAISYIVMLVPTTLMGATFPIVTRMEAESTENLGAEVGGVYSINTLGSIVGSLSAGFLLIPALGLKGATMTAAAVNLAVGIVVLAIWRRRETTALAVLIVGAILAGGWAGSHIESAIDLSVDVTRNSGIRTLADLEVWSSRYRTLMLKDNAQGRVAVLRTPDGYLQMRTDGIVEGRQALGDPEQRSDLVLVLPALAADSPKKAMVVGLGTGIMSADLLETPGLERLDTVEINPAVVEGSRYFVKDRLEKDPRSRLVLADARLLLNLSPERYDLIVSQPSLPFSTHATQLFTLETFDLLRDHLNPGGVCAQWIPAHLLTESDTLMMLKTFRRAFPNTYVFGRVSESGQWIELVALGVDGDRKLDPTALLQQAAPRMPEQASTMRAVAGPDELRAVTMDRSIPLNTDDKPLLEFRAPENWLRVQWGRLPS